MCHFDLLIGGRQKNKINLQTTIPVLYCFTKNILLKNIHFQYPGSDYKALKGINLDIKKNTIIGLVGETGSGKSTTIDIISRLLIFQKGTFEIDGKDISSVDIKSWQNLE